MLDTWRTWLPSILNVEKLVGMLSPYRYGGTTNTRWERSIACEPKCSWICKDWLYFCDSHTSQLVSFLVQYVSIYPRSLAYYWQLYCLHCYRTFSVILSRDTILHSPYHFLLTHLKNLLPYSLRWILPMLRVNSREFLTKQPLRLLLSSIQSPASRTTGSRT